ncbi:ATP-grasp domain-containing protein [Streptomyces clavuligerus]|uniref:Biotin carboxylase n=1 Tax=Streptomyces clavuligerus TaxID=1901 RepID=D5SIN4_STRCL|nr:ATP-grasp domain-containing protein [Streptomyces clavuligerus]EFG03777.1 biotin carboxylase [Streptomyces clavuligerus]MBY6307693.1 ATP-grasp domain-containing protein [Streptomyces clavuligerus]QCS09760.1 ATP-grasp domain-containing protein [Streptomyces clavuligerus]QPJ98196.1 ATP-grasp domain-containing protein [Streptomyces clavuligerus]WDN56467.1 ATP-grasp domain-containing protein [Streptomyces clavuligerus]
MPTSAPTAVVVDGYYNAASLPPAFARRGFSVVHVQSTPEPIPSWTPPDLSVYRENIVHTDDASTVRRLKEYDPVCVIAGQEPGVPLADRLSETLGLPTNGTRLSGARRDKYAMAEALRAAGLCCADQFRSGRADEIVAWVRARGSYPVVLKPLRSCNTDGVTVCATADEVRRAAEQVLTSRDAFGAPNTEVLVQSYLDGDEYIVDTVSRDGEHFVSSVWKYEKTLVDGRNLYDKDILVPPGDAPAPQLMAYVRQALDALGIRHGPAHSEVKMTSRGPALVETGARLSGGMLPEVHDLCLGQNQADLTVLAHTDPGEFRRRYAGRSYRPRQAAMGYTVATTADGVVRAVDEEVVARIGALPTVRRTVLNLAPGQRIRPTVDLATCTMRVHLTGPTQEAVLADYARVRALKDRVYVL